MTIETKAIERRHKIKQAIKAAALGAILGFVCHLLPPEYRVACETIVNVCTGNL